MAQNNRDEKADITRDAEPHIFQDEHPEKPIPTYEKKDYSGAHEKTDPKEIALVKKLDRWMMPMLWSMYWLNYLDRNAIALARLNDLEEDLNLQGTGKLSSCLERDAC